MVTEEDSLLLKALQSGDEQAFNTLFTLYWKKLYAVAFHRLNDESEADDLVQELFVSLWEKRENIFLQKGFEQYLMGAIKFKIINVIRSRTVKEKVFDVLKDRMTEIEQISAEHFDYDGFQRVMEQSLQGMPQNMRRSFEMRSDNMSIKEIAQQLGLAEQTVRNYLAESIFRLRASIGKNYAGNNTLLTTAALIFVNNYLT